MGRITDAIDRRIDAKLAREELAECRRINIEHGLPADSEDDITRWAREDLANARGRKGGR